MTTIRTFQSRIGAKLDKLKRKLIDNSISLTGNTLDFMRITHKKTYQGDIESRIVEEVGLIEVVMPPMTDIPMRRIRNENGDVAIDSMDATELFPFEVYTLNRHNMDRDDILFRVIQDPEVDRPYVMILQIKDTLMTLGSHSPLWKKFTATFYDQQLPQEILDLVIAAQNRRIELGW